MDRTLLRIDSLLKHADKVIKDTSNLSVEELEKASLLLRATCFSIAQIGEIMNQLEKDLQSKYPNLPWVPARKMKNIIVHDYGNTDVEIVYLVIHQDLCPLRDAFLAIKNDIANDGIIFTERLRLRKIRKEDAESIFKNWASDPLVTEYVTWSAHKSIEDTRTIVDKWVQEYEKPETFRYGITLKDKDELIGSIDVVDFIDGKPEIGYTLARKYWNQGIMTEACTYFLKYLCNIGYKEIVIEADERNIGSNRVIEKCGFVFTHKETREIKNNKVIVNWFIKEFK